MMIRIVGVVRILSNSCRALSSSHKLYFPRKNPLATESHERWKKYVETIPGILLYYSFILFLAAETISFLKSVCQMKFHEIFFFYIFHYF